MKNSILFCTLLILTAISGCTKTDNNIIQPTPVINDYPVMATIVNTVNPCNHLIVIKINKLDSGLMEVGFVLDTLDMPTLERYKTIRYNGGVNYNNGAILPDTYSVDDLNLDYDRNYYIRAYIKYAGKILYGNDIAFKVNDDTNSVKKIPEVQTILVNAYSTYVNVEGEIIDKGGSQIIYRGFVVGDQMNPTIENAVINSQLGKLQYSCDSTFNAQIPLNQNQIYHVRAYVINNTGIGYGNDIALTTRDPNVLFFNFKYGIPVDTVLDNYQTSTDLYDNNYLSIINKLVLPQGINMYIIIKSVDGKLNSNIGPDSSINVGDTFKISYGNSVYFHPDLEYFLYGGYARSYCTFSLNIGGVTNDLKYNCAYDARSNITQTRTADTYSTREDYSQCDTQ